MKIGLIVYGSLDILTGGFLYDRKIVEYLQSRGDTVKVFTLPMRPYPLSLADNFDRGFFNRLRSADIDVLLQDELNHPSLFYLNRRLKSEVSYPIVSIVHHLRCNEPRFPTVNRLHRAVERRFLETADAFVCNSHTTAQSVIDLVGDSRPCVVAHPATSIEPPMVKEDHVRTKAGSAGPLRVLFVGNVIERKQLLGLISGLALWKHGDWRLDIVGTFNFDRAYAAQCVALMRKHRIEDRIRILGSMTKSRLAEIFQQNHVLANPSSYEGFGIVYLEAMAFGLPAIGSAAGGPREIIDHGKTGFLVEADKPETSVDFLRELHADREMLANMGIDALNRYRNHPTWNDAGKTVRDFLMEISECR